MRNVINLNDYRRDRAQAVEIKNEIALVRALTVSYSGRDRILAIEATLDCCSYPDQVRQALEAPVLN